jgi:hypothetical protein
MSLPKEAKYGSLRLFASELALSAANGTLRSGRRPSHAPAATSHTSAASAASTTSAATAHTTATAHAAHAKTVIEHAKSQATRMALH